MRPMPPLPAGESSSLTPSAIGAYASGAGLGAGHTKEIVDAYLNDGCAFVQRSGIWRSSLLQKFSMTDCRAAGSGIISRGLHGAIQSQVALARSFCDERGRANVPDDVGGSGTIEGPEGRVFPYSIPGVLNNAEMSMMVRLAALYSTP
jgi:hypothetical protein